MTTPTRPDPDTYETVTVIAQPHDPDSDIYHPVTVIPDPDPFVDPDPGRLVQVIREPTTPTSDLGIVTVIRETTPDSTLDERERLLGLATPPMWLTYVAFVEAAAHDGKADMPARLDAEQEVARIIPQDIFEAMQASWDRSL